MSTLADQIRRLLPPLSYDGNAPLLSATIEAEAKALGTSDLLADSVYETIFPDTGAGLSDWERALALPDPCLQGDPLTIRQRIQAVVSKLQSRGRSKS